MMGDAGMAVALDRASRIAERKNSGVTAGDEPLVIDLAPPIQSMHWTVYQLAAKGFFAVRQPGANPLVTTGLYLVPINAPVESLADASNTTFGMHPEARAIALPYVLTITRAGAGGQFAFTCYATLYSELIVPTGWMLRFIANVLPGTANPGPGAASQGFLFAHVIEEDNSQARARGRV